MIGKNTRKTEIKYDVIEMGLPGFTILATDDNLKGATGSDIGQYLENMMKELESISLSKGRNVIKDGINRVKIEVYMRMVNEGQYDWKIKTTEVRSNRLVHCSGEIRYCASSEKVA